jgi:hypothetical protein
VAVPSISISGRKGDGLARVDVGATSMTVRGKRASIGRRVLAREVVDAADAWVLLPAAISSELAHVCGLGLLGMWGRLRQE